MKNKKRCQSTIYGLEGFDTKRCKNPAKGNI